MNLWRCARYELDGNTSTKTQDLDRFGHRYDVIPYSCGVLVCISYRMILRDYICMYLDVPCPLGDPYLSLYTLEGYGYKENIIFGTIQ